VVRELPSNGRSVEVLLWSERKKDSKADKWEGGRLVFCLVCKGFKKKKVGFLFPKKVQRDLLCNVLEEAIFSSRNKVQRLRTRGMMKILRVSRATLNPLNVCVSS
jgi:hypothetical protein